MEDPIISFLNRHKKVKKVYFIIEIILLSIIIFNYIIALFLGKKYDLIYVIPAIISLIVFIIFMTYYVNINLNKLSINNLTFDYLKFKYKILITLTTIIFGSPLFILFGHYIYRGGSAVIRDNEFAIVRHQDIVRFISESEYNFIHFFQRSSMLFTVPLILIFVLFLKFYDDYDIIEERLRKASK